MLYLFHVFLYVIMKLVQLKMLLELVFLFYLVVNLLSLARLFSPRLLLYLGVKYGKEMCAVNKGIYNHPFNTICYYMLMCFALSYIYSFFFFMINHHSVINYNPATIISLYYLLLYHYIIYLSCSAFEYYFYLFVNIQLHKFYI